MKRNYDVAAEQSSSFFSIEMPIEKIFYNTYSPVSSGNNPYERLSEMMGTLDSDIENRTYELSE